MTKVTHPAVPVLVAPPAATVSHWDRFEDLLLEFLHKADPKLVDESMRPVRYSTKAPLPRRLIAAGWTAWPGIDGLFTRVVDGVHCWPVEVVRRGSMYRIEMVGVAVVDLPRPANLAVAVADLTLGEDGNYTVYAEPHLFGRAMCDEAGYSPVPAVNRLEMEISRSPIKVNGQPLGLSIHSVIRDRDEATDFYVTCNWPIEWPAPAFA